jgi:hypothetical protein
MIPAFVRFALRSRQLPHRSSGKASRVRAASEELKTNGLDQIRANVDRGNVPLENAKAS